jgi:hypothetical protein
MTTKVITIQKENIITLPGEWLRRFHSDRIEASFVNGSIILGEVKEESEKDYLPGLKESIKRGEEDIKKGRIFI